MVDNNNVELAFVEKADHSQLVSHQFPSKLGGKPSWLSLSPVPLNSDLECPVCKKHLTFLLQIYSPDENVKEAFHRTIFIFICRNVSCYKKGSNSNFSVLRSQLSRENDFYSLEPPKQDSDGPSADSFHSLCKVCGLRGPKRCGRCQSATYCSKDHQEVDWKKGHKTKCKKNSEKDDVNGLKSVEEFNTGVNFPEYELVTEPEVCIIDEEKEKSEDEKLEEYQEFMKSNEAKSMLPENASKDLEKMALSEEKQDKVFLKFKERIKDEQEQVLRYQRNGKPLWVSSQNIPKEEDIPKCSCGAFRTFEFQVMPQILNYMEVDSLEDSIDWGTLCVYTCSKCCNIGNNYHKEFLWKQDFSDSSL